MGGPGFADDVGRGPEKWLLLMLFAGGSVRKYNEPVVGKTKLMKEVFLLHQEEPNLHPRYAFRPYHYGPFSGKLTRDLYSLVSRRIVASEAGFGSEIFSLTPNGTELASELWDMEDQEIQRRLFRIKVRFNRMPLSEFLSLIYDRYPRFASESIYQEPPE